MAIEEDKKLFCTCEMLIAFCLVFVLTASISATSTQMAYAVKKGIESRKPAKHRYSRVIHMQG